MTLVRLHVLGLQSSVEMSTDGLEGSASFDSEEEDVVPVKDDFVIHNPPLGEYASQGSA